MSSKQTKRSFAPTPGKLAYGDTLDYSSKPIHKYKGNVIYIKLANDPYWFSSIEGEIARGTLDEVIAAIDGEPRDDGPAVWQHLKTVPKE